MFNIYENIKIAAICVSEECSFTRNCIFMTQTKTQTVTVQ